jgi:NAD(P)-dependent dehydrogenase (short-subunit alcohol dehydrogenase family)
MQRIFPLDLTGHAALVAGGAQGIGESTVMLLAECGCDLLIVDVMQDKANAVADRARALGVRAEVVVYDLVANDEHDGLITEAVRRLPHLDCLVTVVGGAGWQSILKTSRADWEARQRLNLGYVFAITKSFASCLVSQHRSGAIVCISSVSGLQGAPQHAPYGAAKAGMIHLIKTMAVEWSRYGIRANSVAPGTIVTPRREETAERAERVRRSHIPMKRRGTARDIAHAVVFLLSDMATYITGQTLAVDGGWTAANLLIDVETTDGDQDWSARD